jgi:hypothetical protein
VTYPQQEQRWLSIFHARQVQRLTGWLLPVRRAKFHAFEDWGVQHNSMDTIRTHDQSSSLFWRLLRVFFESVMNIELDCPNASLFPFFLKVKELRSAREHGVFGFFARFR